MARQRFIWPSLWTDKAFGELPHDAQVLFIALFSLADDEGRISADPMYLRAQVFPYKDYSAKRVQGIRDRVVERFQSVHLYEIGSHGEEAIALLEWSEYQKPKYPKPSNIPPPFPEASSIVAAAFPPRAGQGWVGLDREGQGREETHAAVAELSSAIRNKDDSTAAMLLEFAELLPAAAFYEVRSELKRKGTTIDNDAGYARTILERMVNESQYQQVALIPPSAAA